MATHEITLNSPWYEYVKSGEKIYEGRRYTEKVKAIQPGDMLKISHHIDKSLPFYNKTVVGISRFSTFEQALTLLNEQGLMQKVLPNVATIAEGVEIYLKYVSLATQVKDGVCLIEMK